MHLVLNLDAALLVDAKLCNTTMPDGLIDTEAARCLVPAFEGERRFELPPSSMNPGGNFVFWAELIDFMVGDDGLEPPTSSV